VRFENWDVPSPLPREAGIAAIEWTIRSLLPGMLAHNTCARIELFTLGLLRSTPKSVKTNSLHRRIFSPEISICFLPIP